MLGLRANISIFLYQDAVSMHKSFEGLSKMVEESFPGKLFTQSLFLFFNRKRDCVKMLYWDEDGFMILYKRLEKGSFHKMGDKTSLNRRELLMLLEGITPKKLQRRYSHI